jgi:hypothetical protein
MLPDDDKIEEEAWRAFKRHTSVPNEWEAFRAGYMAAAYTPRATNFEIDVMSEDILVLEDLLAALMLAPIDTVDNDVKAQIIKKVNAVRATGRLMTTSGIELFKK